MQTSVLPNVLYCSVEECAYNNEKKCHAGGITIDGPEPLCGTFFRSSHKGGVESEGAVGACKNHTCVYNEFYECTASGINVTLHANKPECDTFKPADATGEDIL